MYAINIMKLYQAANLVEPSLEKCLSDIHQLLEKQDDPEYSGLKNYLFANPEVFEFLKQNVTDFKLLNAMFLANDNTTQLIKSIALRF